MKLVKFKDFNRTEDGELIQIFVDPTKIVGLRDFGDRGVEILLMGNHKIEVEESLKEVLKKLGIK